MNFKELIRVGSWQAMPGVSCPALETPEGCFKKEVQHGFA